jgi:AraC-like DNA-binding protein
MQKVMQIIKEKISHRDLNVEMLADAIGISRVHLHRKIKEITGLSARDYLKNIRMKQASLLLTDRRLTISEIAYAVGYSNPAHFSASFKAFYGVSPSEYAGRGARDDGDEPAAIEDVGQQSNNQ